MIEDKTSYGINVKYNQVLGFERLCTFDDVTLAYAAYFILAKSVEASNSDGFELEKITELENGDFEYLTLIS